MKGNPFRVRGKLTVRDSATVICARRRVSAESTLCPEDLGGTFSKMFSGQKKAVFGRRDCVTFSSGWEVLMGQSEVINFMKTRPSHSKPKTMRYGGEYKLPGGMVEPSDSSPMFAAKRELSEEFLIPPETLLHQKSTNIRPFTVKQTRPVRSRSNMMLCYIALESENDWLKRLDVEKTNRRLADRRSNFAKIVSSDKTFFETTPLDERERLTPEVHEVRWMSLRDAVRHALSSLCQEEVYVNEFQRKSFRKLGRRRRDPMFITAALLMELETFPNEESVIRHCESSTIDSLKRGEQWLFEGMTEEDTKKAFTNRYRHGFNATFKSPSTVSRLREMRKGFVDRTTINTTLSKM
jgi:8-oxo-dGTP pyrophosphatase MutT (NUDIX family)